MNLQRIYETLKREYESKGIQIDEGKLRQMAWMKRDRMLFESSMLSTSAAAAGAAGAGGGGGRRLVPQCLPLGGVTLSADFNGAYVRFFLAESGTLNGQPQYLGLFISEGNNQIFLRISWTGSEWALSQVSLSDGNYNEFDFAFSPTLFSNTWQTEGPGPGSFVTSPGEEFDCSWRHCFTFIGDGEFTLGFSPAWIDAPLTESPNAYILPQGDDNIFWDEEGLSWIVVGPDEGQLSILPGGTREQLPIGQFTIFDGLVLTISSGICSFTTPTPPPPPPPPPPQTGFIFRVDTSLGNGNASFQIPTSGEYVYNYTATWTLVSDPSITGTVPGLTGTITIPFLSGGIYDIEITGLFPAMEFGKSSPDPEKVIGIIQWGSNQWQSMNQMFLSCSNLSLYLATDQPDLSGVTDMSSMFNSASSFNGDLSGWDVSAVTDMNSMFYSATSFNADISSWDVSAVTNMNSIFSGASAFNADISGWDVSAVTSMDFMFFNASSFNQNLSGWCVSLIPSTPSNFDTGATAWVLSRPVWGSCPG